MRLEFSWCMYVVLTSIHVQTVEKDLSDHLVLPHGCLLASDLVSYSAICGYLKNEISFMTLNVLTT